MTTPMTTPQHASPAGPSFPADLPTSTDLPAFLSHNVAYFARTLRAAGLPIGPGAVLDALDALSWLDLSDKAAFKSALGAVFVKRHADQPVFDQAFALFWRRRAYLEKMMAAMLPTSPEDPAKSRPETFRRLSEALYANRPHQDHPPPDKLDLDASMTFSQVAMLREKDFEAMSAEELRTATKAVRAFELRAQTIPTRRKTAAAHGQFDPRASLRESLRLGGDALLPRFKTAREITPPILALCDISGSMSRYAQVFLHFLHALASSGRRVHAFTFATELTHITRALASHKDAEIALAHAAKTVRDWDGGTRIGPALAQFNRHWLRRCTAGGPIVLLLTDGLERDDHGLLAQETARLKRAVRRVIWLNPLLRFDGFEPQAGGIRALLPQVDEFRPFHSLNSVAQLCDSLGKPVETAHNARLWASRAAR